MNPTRITELDEKYVWHPYTQHGLGEAFLPVTSAKEATLYLEDGNTLLDAISSWWVNVLGHGNPAVSHAIQTQCQKLDHVLFAGFTHEPAVKLAQELVEYNRNFSKVFYSDNGSTAVEIALKMAYQYFVHESTKQGTANTRKKFLALHGSYHGDTFGAMAVGSPNGLHPCFRELLAPVDFVHPGNWSELEARIRQCGNEYAAFIVEPLIQGASGMKTYPAEYLKKATELCRAAGIFTIYDEVFTGFYRTGTCFAYEQVGVNPDFLCLSKGITGGSLPLAATLVTQKVFDGFCSDQLSQAFLHGHSYTANPIACAAALATWSELQQPKMKQKIATIAAQTQTLARQLESHPAVQEVRTLGTIGAIELKGTTGYFSNQSKEIRALSIQRGILLRPLGNVIYTVPPYCVTEAEMVQIYRCIAEILDEIHQQRRWESGKIGLKSNHETPSNDLLFEITDV